LRCCRWSCPGLSGAQLVVLGQMSIHGVLSRADGLGAKLRVARIG